MSTLIITLPLTPGDASTRYSHALSPDGQSVAASAVATAATLPDAGRGVDETVVIVPVAALSWQRVELPQGIGPGSPRLRAVLQSLLEDRLLDDPDTLHLALEPGARAGQAAWVAVCERAWLSQHLHTLEAAGHPASRIVPEFAPHAGELRVQVLGESESSAQMVLSGDGVVGGVARLPLHADTLGTALGAAGLPDNAEVLAEPAIAALTEQLLHCKVRLQQAAQRHVQSTQTPWDLAQFDLASTGRIRLVKRLAGAAREFGRAPAWRAARWGLVLLALAHLVGLNAWAWQESARWQAKRELITRTLTQTFPGVKVVVDAPVQMAREVALLRQATGAPSNRDLEAMLSAAGNALPAGRSANALDYTAGELHLKGLNLSSAELNELSERLRPMGYSARSEGSNSLLIQTESAR